jgi:hypothetical protein
MISRIIQRKYFIIPCILILLLETSMFGQSSKHLAPAIEVPGCELLDRPALYTGKMVKVSGLVTEGYERSDLSFDCPGYIDISFSLYGPDLKKYGFLTEKSSQDAMSRHFQDQSPANNLEARENQEARATVVGLFRCHYDFPNCKKFSRFDDASIIIRSVTFQNSTPASPDRK